MLVSLKLEHHQKVRSADMPVRRRVGPVHSPRNPATLTGSHFGDSLLFLGSPDRRASLSQQLVGDKGWFTLALLIVH